MAVSCAGSGLFRYLGVYGARKEAEPVPTLIPESLSDLTVPIDSLTPYAGNPRIHNMPVIRESLRTNGQFRPIVVNRGTLTGRPSEILAGNGTWEGAVAEKWDRIAVTWVDVDDETAIRILAVDNRANDLASTDDRLLAELLATLPDLDGTGYDEDAFRILEALIEGVPSSGVRVGGPDEEWTGLPEYESANMQSAFRSIVHFATEQDADDFFKLIGMKRSRLFWWPEHDGFVGSTGAQVYVAPKD